MMLKKYVFTFLILTLAFTFFRCNKQPIEIVKNHNNDPFKNSIPASEIFEIDTKTDTVLAGQKGTILVFQEGSFLDTNGNVVTEGVEIELAEALTLDDMVLSNLTTTSENQLLETDGMIYFNATSKGEQLFINPEKPVYIEIPSVNRKSGMSVYQGVRDENGNMNWQNPIPIINQLTAVDLFSLDFLPDGFAEAAEKEMPFFNRKTADEQLIDSLYYSLYFKTGKEISEENLPSLNITEPLNSAIYESELDSLYYVKSFPLINYGVNPAVIKTIRNENFQNTLIATRQFEERLKFMFKICRTDIIDIYTHNLDKNLWELDSIATSLLDDNLYQTDFKKFADQRWTTIKEPNKNLNLLKRFYAKRIQAVENLLTEQRNNAVKEENKKTEKAKKHINTYKKLLKQREAYRMTGYGFTMTETGWINIDRGTITKNWGFAPLQFSLTNKDTFDRAYGYVLYKSIKSLFRLKSKDAKTFSVGNDSQNEMPMPKNDKAIGIVIAYQNEQAFVAISEFEPYIQGELEFTLKPTSMQDLKKTLNAFEYQSKENSILEDLRYVDEIYMEKLRQDKLEHEQLITSLLQSVASPVDSTFIVYDRMFAIDVPKDTCLNKIRGLQSDF